MVDRHVGKNREFMQGEFMRRYSRIFIAMALLLWTVPLAAADKPLAAVLDFEAVNCPKSLSRIVSDIVSAKVFEARIFTMVERKQIQEVFREMELQMTGCTDAACAVKVGRLLSASRIITGTIHKADRYIVVLKVVNVEDGRVEANYRSEAATEEEVEGAVLDMVEKLRYDFNTGMYISVSAGGAFLYPLGDFSKLADYGFGAAVSVSVNNFMFKSSVLSFATGAYSFTGAGGSVDSIIMVPLTAYYGYTLRVFRGMAFTPFLGVGCLFNLMNYDEDGADVYGNYSYERELFVDPVLSLRADVDYAITNFLHVMAAPVYSIFFEKGGVGMTLGVELGVRLYF
jgi:hypothetical protein